MEYENERMGNFAVWRSEIFSANVQNSNSIYCRSVTIFIYLNTYILFVTKNELVELLLNCVALVFQSMVDDILGSFLSLILLPMKTRTIIIKYLNQAWEFEKN